MITRHRPAAQRIGHGLDLLARQCGHGAECRFREPVGTVEIQVCEPVLVERHGGAGVGEQGAKLAALVAGDDVGRPPLAAIELELQRQHRRPGGAGQGGPGDPADRGGDARE